MRLTVYLGWMTKSFLSSPIVFSCVRCTRSLVLCVVFCRSLFVLLYFFFWPLCCLAFELRILITPLVFSSSSSLSRWLNVLCIMFKIIPPSPLDLILRTCRKHLYDRIISLRGGPIKLSYLRQLLLKCLFQARKVSSLVFVC